MASGPGSQLILRKKMSDEVRNTWFSVSHFLSSRSPLNIFQIEALLNSKDFILTHAWLSEELGWYQMVLYLSAEKEEG